MSRSAGLIVDDRTQELVHPLKLTVGKPTSFKRIQAGLRPLPLAADEAGAPSAMFYESPPRQGYQRQRVICKAELQ